MWIREEGRERSKEREGRGSKGCRESRGMGVGPHKVWTEIESMELIRETSVVCPKTVNEYRADTGCKWTAGLYV